MDRDTLCAIASPEGRGAIGVIRISGRDAFACLDRVFYAKSGKKAAERVPRDMVMGKIYHGDRLVDEGMCAVFFAPASYTGENSAEIYCHGGRVVTREILAALLESGCRLARGGEFTERAFLNGKMDLAAAEAVEELIDAANPVYVSTAAANLSGRFGRRIREIRDELM
ncbi:MAG: tRNA uridine-5-carboxymethylaminomethyl(34) synthesis GTPase MnmE, partial [Clostridia bacterium]|nr:tRNA uridine-5-carboxymethylaminomethyl(34) synthesis GTPase MnmE [Clostridia bacterium]